MIKTHTQVIAIFKTESLCVFSVPYTTNYEYPEKDVNKDGKGQIQAFGFADSGEGFGPELGYISIKEIVRCGAELDLHWTPCTLRQIKEKAAA